MAAPLQIFRRRHRWSFGRLQRVARISASGTPFAPDGRSCRASRRRAWQSDHQLSFASGGITGASLDPCCVRRSADGGYGFALMRLSAASPRQVNRKDSRDRPEDRSMSRTNRLIAVPYERERCRRRAPEQRDARVSRRALSKIDRFMAGARSVGQTPRAATDDHCLGQQDGSSLPARAAKAPAEQRTERTVWPLVCSALSSSRNTVGCTGCGCFHEFALPGAAGERRLAQNLPAPRPLSGAETSRRPHSSRGPAATAVRQASDRALTVISAGKRWVNQSGEASRLPAINETGRET